jgi:hypothetical protein
MEKFKTKGTVIAVIILIGFAGFFIGRNTAPNTVEYYKTTLDTFIKGVELQSKILQRYMLMYERLQNQLENIMRGRFYVPKKFEGESV